ncbi:cell envelope integrity protein TolA [Buttiauxella sp. B2]|nr:cell envelope integrity protein TolA [Buttiauxella sp. B2]
MRKIHFYSKTSAQFLLFIALILPLTGCVKPHPMTKSPTTDPSPDITHYAKLISSNIESKFNYKKSYAGKHCTLRLKLAPNGMLMGVKSEEGDPELCQAAISATTAVNQFPAPPNQKIYDVFKNAVLDFKL